MSKANDEVREKGKCYLTYAEMAARAGVCRRTARNAVRRAGRLGLVNIEERSWSRASVIDFGAGHWRPLPA
jgi:hypothetical protein